MGRVVLAMTKWLGHVVSVDYMSQAMGFAMLVTFGLGR
jgi:hypothetical protein